MQEELRDEVQLIHQAQNGDAQAFGELYDEFYGSIYGFILNRVKNVEIAKDITSEIFFQALKNLNRFQVRKGISIKSWLFAIAVAQVNSYFRKRCKYLQITMEECPEIVAPIEEQPHALVEQKERDLDRQAQAELLKQHIQSLNLKQQNVLALRYFSKLSVAEVAQAMNMKEGTVKSHIHRAVKKLKFLMNSSQQEEKMAYETKTATNQYRETLGVSSN